MVGGQVRLIQENKKRHIFHGVFFIDADKHVSGCLEPGPVAYVHTEKDAVNRVEVMFPQFGRLFGAAHVPQRKLVVLVDDGLDVQAYCRHCLLLRELVVLHLQQNRCFTCVVTPQEEQLS